MVGKLAVEEEDVPLPIKVEAGIAEFSDFNPMASIFHTLSAGTV